MKLYSDQLKALSKMHNGCILNGTGGAGKSLTALAYYYLQCGGEYSGLTGGRVSYKPGTKVLDLYIITTARKRDTGEWTDEIKKFNYISEERIKIDSWNNIKKYREVLGAFFIFDEDRVIGYGAWTKAFLKIAAANEWIMLSATPGDTWTDYIPVFIANGYYRNKTDFNNQHVIFSPYTPYPKVERYINTGRLIRQRNDILVPMEFTRHTEAHERVIEVAYDRVLYNDIYRNRWNPWKDAPIVTAAELCYALRKVVNSDITRKDELIDILLAREKVIVFYNFDYELEILRRVECEILPEDFEIAEWNGHLHQDIPKSSSWMYLVQYAAGAEGWNCLETNTIIFYSQNYSFKTMQQAKWRIDRRNTPFTDLYYYTFKSKSPIDLAIGRALAQKKQFNETKFVDGLSNKPRTTVTNIQNRSQQ